MQRDVKVLLEGMSNHLLCICYNERSVLLSGVSGQNVIGSILHPVSRKGNVCVCTCMRACCLCACLPACVHAWVCDAWVCAHVCTLK